MNSFTPSATICSAPAVPAPILTLVQSRTERTPASKRTDGHPLRARIATVLRTLATWLPMSVSSTPSAQAISTLSQRDRLGERQ